MQRTHLLAGTLFTLASACASEGPEPDPIGARASAYPSFELINARPFPTTQHQGNPLVKVWTDELATAPYRALSVGATGGRDVAVGAMIVKEMMGASGEPPVLTVMAKQPSGYDPQNGDWWYGRLNADGTATNSSFVGKVGFCISCHAGASGGDHLFGVAADNLTPSP